ncbi:S8 family serine peptidase [Actinotalea sp. C106]|uniref:S8 family serine peptidase n=1 Tax=Actinotalea sp. C106 TaxID=2908644 RepID=UPI002029154A|nr:S8 family serine peptidase [Actinotalea sp. C106]
MSRRRPVLAAVTCAALTVPLTLGTAHAAPAPEPPPPTGEGAELATGADLNRPGGTAQRLADAWGGSAGDVSPALLEAEGQVTAFVQLDSPSGIEAAEAGADVEAAVDEVEALAEEVVPQEATAASPGARSAASDEPTRLSVTANLVAGITVSGDAARIRALAGEDGVSAVHLVVPKEPTNKGADVFTRAQQTWEATGLTGQDVTIGVIDTGLDYTHASFGGPGTAEAYAAAYGEDGTGPVPEDLLDPTKYLGGWDFAGPDYNADPAATAPGATTVPTPDANPIDAPDASPNGGHGTHVAGSAAGFGVQADGTTFREDYATSLDLTDWEVGPGTAPEAGVYALKVFGDNGGSTGLVIDALEWAADPNGDFDYNDRLDIVNLSVGSDTSPADDPENLFIDRLADLGVLAVISSGNGGDVTDIGGSPGNARSALTVANSVADTQTYDAIEVVEAPDAALVGSHAAQNSIYYTGTEDVTAPVVYLGDGVTGCEPLDAYADQAAGSIVWLSWDDDDTSRACGSIVRWNNAEAAGAAGVLIGTELPVFSAGIAGNEGIPGAQLTAASTDALLPAIQAGGVVATVGPSLANAAFVTDESLADTLADSSSRGVHGSLGVLKPDVAAPGTLISSASSGSGTGASTKTGTSMSAPHVAGIAALVAQAHPGWTPQQVKSAVMNTATHDVFSDLDQSGPVYGPERVGSGRVDALDAASTEVLAFATDDADLVSVTFGVVDVGAETLVDRRTVTVRNTGDTARTYATSVSQATSAGGASITAAPASITVPAGGSATVTVTLTADPASLEREIDPTSQEAYDLGIPIPREFVAAVSGRLVLTPEGGEGELRVPVHAAPRLVSDLEAQPVTVFEGSDSAPLTLAGRGVDAGGWTSLVAPFELVAESPRLEDDPATGTSASSVAAADLRYVGLSSTAPQLEAAGQDPATGSIGVGIATQGEWASLGTNVVPIVNTDIDGDGIWDLETYVWKYAPDLDFTTVETYALGYDEASGYSLGELLELSPVNGLWADTMTTVFDSNVAVVPLGLEAVGITAGDTPTFGVSTYSPYAPDATGIVDEVEPFTADPFAPSLWFEAGEGSEDSLWFVGEEGSPFTVHRAGDEDERLLLLQPLNPRGERAQVVDVTTGTVTETTTALAVDGDLSTGEVTLTATVEPAAATGQVRFLDGETELGTAPVEEGVATLETTLAVGSHDLVAVYEPDSGAWAASTSEVVTVEVVEEPELAESVLKAAVPGTALYGLPVPVVATVRTDGPTPSGRVEVSSDGDVLGGARVVARGRSGVAVAVLPPVLAPGTHELTVTYTGNDEVAASSVTKQVRVISWGPWGR